MIYAANHRHLQHINTAKTCQQQRWKADGNYPRFEVLTAVNVRILQYSEM